MDTREKMIMFETIEELLHQSSQVIRCAFELRNKLMGAIEIHGLCNYLIEEENGVLVAYFYTQEFLFHKLYQTFENLILEVKS